MKRSTTSRHQGTALIIGAALLVTACSGDDPAATSSTIRTASPVTATAATDSVPVTDASGTSAPATDVTVTGPTTTIEAAPVYPLTGLPISDEAKALRPALVVKIDNHPDARPQTGLNAADIVFEENVESLTRFAVVFQSQDSDPVGPIRSGRTQDVALLGLLDRPLFAWSGGNPSVTRAIRSSDLVDLSATVAGAKGGFFRSGDRSAPHNLYAATSKLYSFTPVFAPAPPAQFVYRAADEAFNGEAGTGADVKMDGVAVNWAWDDATTSYLRSQNGRRHNDATLGQVNAANVVILEVEYRPSPADRNSPEAQTTGTGTVFVLTGGVLVRGTWTRANRLEPFTLTDDDGEVIALTPGRTWVELSRADSTTLTD